MGEIGAVAILLSDYNELVRIKERVIVAVERITNDKYIGTEDILRILGTELAIKRADELREEADRKRKAWEVEQLGIGGDEVED